MIVSFANARLSFFFGSWGYQSLVEVPTYCHAGGANSMACAQIGGEVDIEMRV